MFENPQTFSPPESLTEKDLRVLALRHARILKKFEFRREQKATRRKQQEMIFSLAQQMAATLVSINENARRNESSAGTPRQPTPTASPQPSIPGIPEKTTPEKQKSNALPARAYFPQKQPPPKIPRRHKNAAATAWGKFCKKIGVEGITVSVLLHLVIFIFALFYVVSTVVAPREKEEFTFVSGSGGGRGGERPSYSDVQKTRRNTMPTQRREHKILAQTKSPAVALPEIPELQTTFSGAGTLAGMSALRGFGDGALSSGEGGGLGGGIGRGLGVGIGNGRNFVGKFQTKQILGTAVTANRIAVYMDNSGSMTQVIPLVRKEILGKFPTSDVYEFFGCGMQSNMRANAPRLSPRDQETWERRKKQLLSAFNREKTPAKAREAARNATRISKKRKTSRSPWATESSIWENALSSYGKALLEKYSGQKSDEDNFFSVSLDLGQWLEMVFTEGGYDTVIVFADFQDYRNGGLANESAVLERWTNAAREHGMRLYLFTTEMMPQNIFLALAQLTQGSAAIPKQISKQSDAAKETAQQLKNFNRKLVVEPKTETKESAVPAQTKESVEEEDDVPTDADDEAFDEEDFDADELDALRKELDSLR